MCCATRPHVIGMLLRREREVALMMFERKLFCSSRNFRTFSTSWWSLLSSVFPSLFLLLLLLRLGCVAFMLIVGWMSMSFAPKRPLLSEFKGFVPGSRRAEVTAAGLWLRCCTFTLKRAACNGDRVSAGTAEPETLRPQRPLSQAANPLLPVYCG